MRKLDSFFTPSDFGTFTWQERAAEIANKVLKIEAGKWIKVGCSWLRESGLTDQHGPGWIASEGSVRSQSIYTHTALLAFIEPIKECEHKNVTEWQDYHRKYMRCLDCDSEVKPVKWEKVLR